MSFAVRLSTDLLSVEAGATTPLSVEVANRSDEADRFELEVEGLDPEWIAVPVPMFQVASGETATEKVFFRTPRTSESQSGNYPFVVKVRSLTTGEQRTVQAVLQIQPYHHISVEISPKRGLVASFKRRNHFTLTLINMGNSEHTLQLLGSDPDDALTFNFEQDQVVLGPGQQKDVGVTVQPTKSKRLISSVVLHGFSISARSIDSASVAAATQGQLEQRPFFTPGGLAFLAVIVVSLWLWWYSRPKPATFEMGLSKASVLQGERISIWWQVSNADRVAIRADGEVIYDSVATNSKDSIFYDAKGDKPVKIQGYAISKDHNTPIQEMLLNIVVPPPDPMPEIVKFTASSKKVRVGDTVIFTFDFNDAVASAVLSPTNDAININTTQIEVPITKEGTTRYTLTAENRSHKAVSKFIDIVGNRESEVKIIAFTATPKALMDPGGLVTISWQLSNAVHVEITPNIDINTNEVDATKGSFNFYADKTTTFTLVAKDKNNLSQTATVRVVVEPPPSTPPGLGPDTPPSDAAGGNR